MIKNLNFRLFSIQNIKRIEFRQDINGLRALSVIAVILYHLDLPFFEGGWLGVDIFFVISGFLISNIIISEHLEGKFLFKKFYLRRARRLLPSLFFTMLITIPFSISILSPKAFEEYTEALLSSLFFYANFYFKSLDFYIAEPSKFNPLLHMWSLAIEEQFYILFPVVLFLFFKIIRRHLFSILLALFSISVYLNSTEQGYDKFYNLEFRAWELLLGALIMIVSSNIRFEKIEILGFILIVFSIYYFGESWILQIEPKLICLFGVSLILLSNYEKSALSRISNLNFVKRVGLSSYSLYLLHQPIFAYFRIVEEQKGFFIFAQNFYEPNIFQKFFIFFGNLQYPKTFLTVFIIILSFLIFEYIEKPFMKKDNFSNVKIAALALSIIFFILFFLNKESYFTYPSDELNEYSLETIVDAEVCWGKSPSYECLEGDGDSIIYLIGDSQLSKIAKQLSSKNKTYSYFFNIEPFGLDFYDRYYSEKCTGCLKDFLNIDKKEKIVIFNARIPHYLQENYFNNGLFTATSKVFKTYPKKYIIEDLNSLIDYSDLFILIYPIPEHAWNVRDLILNKKFSDSNSNVVVSYDKKYWDEYSKDAIDLLDSLQSNKIKRVYPSKIFCENFKPNKCVGEFNNEYFYLDNIHLSSSGAELIVEKIEQILLED